MSRALISKIPASEIRPYIKSTRNSNNIGGGLVLLPRLGAVTFDFSKTAATFCTINFKRDSGNGFLLSNSNGASREHQVTSKSVQAISFELGPDKLLNLSRSQRSRGNVIIMEVLLYEEHKAIKWNDELKKCKDHACLRLVGDDLYASEGAYINGIGVTIKAEPSNMVVTDGSGIRFIGPCKITYLNVVGGQAPPPPKEEPIKKAELVYDTAVDSFNNTYCNGHATASSEGVVLNNLGAYSVPIPDIVFGKSYKITVFATRVDGNGKLMFGLTPNVNSASYNLVTINGKLMSNVVTPTQDNQEYSVSFWRPGSSTGHVKISKIVVEESSSSAGFTQLVPSEYPHINLTVSPALAPKILTEPVVTDSASSIIVSSSDAGIGIVDKIEASSKRFAIFPAPKNSLVVSDIEGSVKACGFTARQWLFRLQATFPNIKHDTESKVAVCDVNSIINAPVILLQEFSGVKRDQIASLESAKTIFTPSLENKALLSHWFPKATVDVCQLPLPKTRDRGSENGYFMYFESDRIYTKHLLDVTNEKLCIVGTRLNIPAKHTYLSDYEDHDVLCKYIAGSNGLIDLNRNTHYRSGIVDLALGLGVPVLTNNINYFGRATLVRHTDSSMVSKELLSEGLRKLEAPDPNKNHNDAVVGLLRRLGVVA